MPGNPRKRLLVDQKRGKEGLPPIEKPRRMYSPLLPAPPSDEPSIAEAMMAFLKRLAENGGRIAQTCRDLELNTKDLRNWRLKDDVFRAKVLEVVRQVKEYEEHWKSELKAEFLEARALCGTDIRAADVAGLKYGTLTNWKLRSKP